MRPVGKGRGAVPLARGALFSDPLSEGRPRPSVTVPGGPGRSTPAGCGSKGMSSSAGNGPIVTGERSTGACGCGCSEAGGRAPVARAPTAPKTGRPRGGRAPRVGATGRIPSAGETAPSPTARASAAGCEICTWLPPAESALCEEICTRNSCAALCDLFFDEPLTTWCKLAFCGATLEPASDYELVPRDGEDEDGIGVGCPDSVTVSIAPSNTTAGIYGSWSFEAGCESAWSDLTMLFDGEQVARSPFFDADTLNLRNEYSWTRAPDELKELWPQFAPFFDDPDFDWVYLAVGGGNEEFLASCTPVVYPSVVLQSPTFVVSALRPYAAYEVRQVGVVGTEGFGFRIRYWVGVMHHFSMFVPNPAAPEGPFTDADIAAVFPNAWNATTQTVPSRGWLVANWAAYITRVGAGVRWSDPVAGDAHTGTYFACNPGLCPASIQYGFSYVDNDGAPTGLCFSDRLAWDAAPSDASGDMTSLLGASLWGEVCVVTGAGYDLQDILERGFEALFGEEARVGLEIRWFDRGGQGRGGSDARPHALGRYYCLRAEDLEDAEALAAQVLAKRSSGPTRWLYRDFDPTRLQAAVAGFEADADPCPCVSDRSAAPDWGAPR